MQRIINRLMTSRSVRHRPGGQSLSPPIPSQKQSIALSINTNNNGVDNDSEHGKVHGRRRREELLRSNRNLIVLGGALSIVALCLVGMWASSTSVNKRSTTPRQMDQRPHYTPRHNRVDRDRKTRPRGTGYRQEEEEMFPIPQNPDEDIEIHKRHHHDEVKVQEPQEPNEDDKDKEEPLPEIKQQESEEDSKDVSPEIEQEDSVSGEEDLYDERANEGVPEERGDRRHYKENAGDHDDREHYKKSVDHDVDEDRAKSVEESFEELSDDKKKAHHVHRSEPKPLSSSNIGDSAIQPRVLRLQFEKKYNSLADRIMPRGEKPKLGHTDFLLTTVQRLPTHEEHTLPSSDQVINPYPDDDKFWERQEDLVKKSKKYRQTEREPLEDEKCEPRHDWQKGAFPNCNILHEYELGHLSGMYGRAHRKGLRKEEGDGDELVKYLAHGYWRDVWLVSKTSRSFETKYDNESDYDEEITVLKTLRYMHDFTDRNYDRHRKDALASERLSKSPNVVDIFAYCSNSAVFEYGSEGDIEHALWPYDKEKRKYYVADLSPLEKLEMAYEVSRSIGDMHDIEGDGFASIAHTDITPSQFIYINGRWKLNDFNRCRFMRVYKEDNSVCGFYVGANPGKFRSPEEYNYEEEDEMVDVYSMGNIFYAILSGEMPFEGKKEKYAQEKIIAGKRPPVPIEVIESEDPAIKTLFSAMKKCWRQKPGDRYKASRIQAGLKDMLDKLKAKNATRTAEK